MTEYAIELEGVSKLFEKVDFKRKLKNMILLRGMTSEKTTALNEVSLEVERGEIFGLLGPNGAGKTTMIKILNTILTPDSGSAKVNGFDVVKESLGVRQSIGILPEDSERGFFWRLSARTNLLFYAREYMVECPKERVEEVSQLLGLEDEDMSKWFQKLSKGTKQKVALARSLIPDSPVLFMDEPQRSLDVLFMSTLKELVREKLGKEDRTIFLSSHDMHFIEETCDRVAVINKGRIVTVRKVKELKALFGGVDTIAYTLEVTTDSIGRQEALCENLRLVDGVEQAKPMGAGKIEVQVRKNRLDSVNRILQTVMDQKCGVVSFARMEVGLDEAIMKLLRDGEN